MIASKTAPGNKINPDCILLRWRTPSVKIGTICSEPNKIMKVKMQTRHINLNDRILKIATFSNEFGIFNCLLTKTTKIAIPTTNITISRTRLLLKRLKLPSVKTQPIVDNTTEKLSILIGSASLKLGNFSRAINSTKIKNGRIKINR